ncbi:hypothetical protein H0264_06910 [Nocardia huaxiensis]|uniref:Excreted virulence factor EspC (Type VII ESX diderm) n=1 Tax=Nocardia huaxiensis TaxID=2755382 RepID=A0A7D6ZKS7_9NOCA|nr:type VII secretion target [Nocardia huaxiensis]QLY32020.1 hypothetical protein H0264_06910 [Nocardia huaxiensis]
MPGISIDPAAMTAYTAAATHQAATLTTASILAATADPLALAPALGRIGADFLAAYAAAHTTHTGSLAALSTVLASLGTATNGSADAYITTDRTNATTLSTLTPEANI